MAGLPPISVGADDPNDDGAKDPSRCNISSGVNTSRSTWSMGVLNLVMIPFMAGVGPEAWGTIDSNSDGGFDTSRCNVIIGEIPVRVTNGIVAGSITDSFDFPFGR